MSKTQITPHDSKQRALLAVMEKYRPEKLFSTVKYFFHFHHRAPNSTTTGLSRWARIAGTGSPDTRRLNDASNLIPS